MALHVSCDVSCRSSPIAKRSRLRHIRRPSPLHFPQASVPTVYLGDTVICWLFFISNPDPDTAGQLYYYYLASIALLKENYTTSLSPLFQSHVRRTADMAKTIVILGGSYAGLHVAHYFLKQKAPDLKVILVSKVRRASPLGQRNTAPSPFSNTVTNSHPPEQPLLLEYCLHSGRYPWHHQGRADPAAPVWCPRSVPFTPVRAHHWDRRCDRFRCQDGNCLATRRHRHQDRLV